MYSKELMRFIINSQTEEPAKKEKETKTTTYKYTYPRKLAAILWTCTK